MGQCSIETLPKSYELQMYVRESSRSAGQAKMLNWPTGKHHRISTYIKNEDLNNKLMNNIIWELQEMIEVSRLTDKSGIYLFILLLASKQISVFLNISKLFL